MSEEIFAPAVAAHPAARPLVEMADIVFAAGGKTLVNHLSLSLKTGSKTVIMGPNGAGKSLTMRLIAGLLAPTKGRIIWPDTSAPMPDPRQVSIVFQKPVLLRRTVAQNLRHALAVYGVSADRQPEQIEKYLAMGQLQDLASRPARVLSGGEQQRLSVVRALAAEPKVLLLDEPTASLDPQATQMIETLITDTHAEGTKIVLVTHDPGQARRIADDVVFIQGGQVTEHSPAKRFFSKPQSEAAQAYLAGRLVF